MPNPDPNQPGQSPDPLDELRERIARTQEAAERLAQAARSTPPPAGWQTPREGGGAAELRAALTLADAVRSLVPPDLAEQISALVRELLLALRALIDYCVDRLERRRAEPVEVEDIPIG